MPDQQHATDVFVIVIDDRHSDTDAEVWTDQASAEQRARDLVQEYARHPEDIEDEVDGLNDVMRADGWTFYQPYSPEGDHVHVMRRPIHGGAVRHGKGELGRFVNRPDDVVVFPEAAARITAWRRAGGVAIGLTNQGGIGLGYMTHDDNAEITYRTLNLSGLNEVITCEHAPGVGCWCRKPMPGLVYAALRWVARSERYTFADPADCLMVGDMDTDRQCAERAGVPFQWAADWRAGA